MATNTPAPLSMKVEIWPIDRLIPYEKNPRKIPQKAIDKVAASIQEFGFCQPIVADAKDVTVVGHTRHLAAKKLRLSHVPVVVASHLSPAQCKAYRLADNRSGEETSWDNDILFGELSDLEAMGFDIGLTSFDAIEISTLRGGDAVSEARETLAARFLIPPFSVLNAREGWWQDRKAAWIALGIQSELGRGGNLLKMSDAILEPDPAKRATKKSARAAVESPDLSPPAELDFTPCEETYARFMPKGGNAVVQIGHIWAKRDDKFSKAGVLGGKVRSCWELAQGAPGLVTAGSRASPQISIVAHIAWELGIPCRAHCPEGDLGPEVAAARNCGAEIIQHPAGRNSVIIARAREDAAAHGWREIPFGMECWETVRQTSWQTGNIPAQCNRVVVPVGSGMSLAGILWGLKDIFENSPGWLRGPIPVVGIICGADPIKRLDKYAPPEWREMCELISSGHDYHKAVEASVGGVGLDPIYEAKCVPFLKPGDLLWIVGIRESASD